MSFTSTTKVLVNACAAGLVLAAVVVGCSSAPTPPHATTPPEVLVCGTYATYKSDGTPVVHKEWYALPAIRYKLQALPQFAAAIGVTDVTTCDQARAYFDAEAGYRAAHPSFDAALPLPSKHPPPPTYPTSAKAPELKVPKVANGQPATQSPVVEILNATGDTCTGTFISKNWIATAGHCTAPGTNPAQTVNPNQPDSLFMWTPVTVRWFLDGTAIAPNDATNLVVGTAPQLTTYALQYVDPRYEGPGSGLQNPGTQWAKANPVYPHGAYDFALLYLDKYLNVPFLPPSADDGGAMRISLNPDPGQFDFFYGAGFGDVFAQQTDHLNEGANVGLAPFSQAAPDLLEATVPAQYTGPLICHGDSGGPITRTVNVLQPDGSSVQELAIVGILSGFIGNQANNCGMDAGDVYVWVRADLERDFINRCLEDENGCGFSCSMDVDAMDISTSFMQCWGSPCQTDNDCPDPLLQSCSQSGANTTIGSPACPICACQAGDCTVPNFDCDCVVGECLPKAGLSDTSCL